MAGLVALDRVDPTTHWLRLVPVAVGCVATGIGFAAILRARGVATPGDVAAVLALGSTLLVLAVNPLRRWVTATPLGNQPHTSRSLWLWLGVTFAWAVVVARCCRDPAHSK